MLRISSRPRRILASSLACLLAAVALVQVAAQAQTGVSDEQAVAGIEREGDIPLPVASA